MAKIEKNLVLVQNILDKVGGTENIKDVYHCATRMRLTLINQDLANIKELKAVTSIKGALWSNGELQLIIGAEVSTITDLLKTKLNENHINQSNNLNNNFITKKIIQEKNVSIWKRFLKSISAFFGPLIPFLIGVGLIMAFQQFLIRTNLGSDPTKEGAVLGNDYNMFDYVLNVISSTGFKLMGVVAMWSVVRYLGGKVPTAIALALIMVSPIIPESGIDLLKLGNWQITLKPFYSTILVFIVMGVLIAFSQKAMDKYFQPVVNFILNPFLTILVGGMVAFFIMGPIMGIIENALLSAFDWFMNLPIGIGALIVGLTWQPLVVLGVHNILFFAAVADLVKNDNPSIFLAAAFAAAWAQMGATIAVGIKSKKNIDRSAAFAAALPGIISGPTESCIYGVNLPKGIPFLTGVLAGGLGGWLIGIFKVSLDNLAGLGGIVGFLAYTDDLMLAIIIDIASLVLGIVITYFLWKEDKTELYLAKKTTKKLSKFEFLLSNVDYSAICLKKLLKKLNKKNIDKKSLIDNIKVNTQELKMIGYNFENEIEEIINENNNEEINNNLFKKIIKDLKLVKSDRQITVNKLYLDLKNSLKELKKLNIITKKNHKYLIKKSNLEFEISRINDIREIKIASAYNKAQKYIQSNDKNKIELGRKLMDSSNCSNFKSDKLKVKNTKLNEVNNVLKENQNYLSEQTNKYYNNIIYYLNEIEKVKNKSLNVYKDMYYNDIHSLEIKENLVKPKII